MNMVRYGWIALLALSVMGCGKAPDAENQPMAGDQGPASKPLRIVYIPKNTGNPYFNEVNRGFEAAAKELGADYTTTAPATAEATSQIPILKEQVQRGVDIIAISPNSPDTLNQVLDDARSKGITVVTVDADLVGNESHRDACVLPTDFALVGSSQIELLGSLIGYEGEIAILSATTDAPNQNAWIEGMKESLKQEKYSRMKLVDLVYGDDEPQKSTTECEALLAKHPNLRGIVSPTSVGLAASAQVVERAGVYPGGPQAKKPGLQLTGLSTPNQLRKFVEKGVVTSLQLWSPYDEGYLAAHVAAMIHGKKIVPKPGLEVEVPKLGKRTFSEKLELTGGPLVTFDKANIGQYDF